MDKLSLQLSHERSDWSLDVAGSRLTQSEKDCRQSWLDTVYVTLQLCTLAAEGEAGLAKVAALRPWTPEDAWLHSLVERTLHGQSTGEQQLAVRFDRAIATGGGPGEDRPHAGRAASPPALAWSCLCLMLHACMQARLAVQQRCMIP